jgi:hypothetical protein
VGVARDHDGRLQVSEPTDHLERLGILRDVDDGVLDALAIEGLL